MRDELIEKFFETLVKTNFLGPSESLMLKTAMSWLSVNNNIQKVYTKNFYVYILNDTMQRRRFDQMCIRALASPELDMSWVVDEISETQPPDVKVDVEEMNDEMPPPATPRQMISIK